jgi:thioredoxin reductase (NADPH)
MSTTLTEAPPAAPTKPKAEDRRIFPTLDADELELVRRDARVQHLADGELAFRAGEADIDFLVVESGGLSVLNPTDGDAVIVTHGPGHFVGDIDLLTRRPVIFSARAEGPTTVLRLPGAKLRHLLNTVPKLSEKVLVAFQVRRQRLGEKGVAGARVIGPAACRETTEAREFLYRNFVPFVWTDTASDDGKRRMAEFGPGTKTPVIDCGPGRILKHPSLHALAECVGIWQGCPTETFDLAVVGAGPAGMSAAVYAASEGLKVCVLDRLGPGGQAAGSSRIENFIGFPSGLTGTDLATRAVLQMYKFGSHLSVPMEVLSLEPGENDDEPHQLRLNCGASLKAFTVLVATGVKWRKLDVPGAARFERAGVYYACTRVEVEGHQGTDVCVVGGGNSAGQAAMYLAEHCATVVHVLVRGKNLASSMSEYLAARLRDTPNIRLHFETCVAEVFGDRRITGVDVEPRGGGERTRIPCSAVFVFVGSDPHIEWLQDHVATDDKGFVLTGSEMERAGAWPLKDRGPCPLETSIPRVMAAGDVRAGSTKRVGFAVGDGSLACTCTHTLRTLRA